MGKRVHVVKKQMEYGTTEAFNWSQEEFKSLLNALDCGVSEQEEYSDFFESECDEYEKAIGYLKEYKDGKRDFDAIDSDDVDAALSELGMTAEQVLEVMESFWNERDKNSGWIQFSAW